MFFGSLESLLRFYKRQRGSNASSEFENTVISEQSTPPPPCQEITHTRIAGDPSTNIYGGAYCIPIEIMPEFYHHYYTHIFINGSEEYLTEKQLDSDSPILIDLDLKYEGIVTEKKHTESDILNLIFLVYLEKLKTMIEFDETLFYIYVFAKSAVNIVRDKGYTKDGVHIIIGFRLNRSLQLVLRQNIIESVSEIVQLPMMNDWSNAIDETIARGSTNWQLYGSKKPGHEAYQLITTYEVQLDTTDGEFKSRKMEKEFDIAICKP